MLKLKEKESFEIYSWFVFFFPFQASECCCGDGRFYHYPTKKCKASQNVGFMFSRLNDSWSHVVVYGFVYPLIVSIMIAPLCAVLLGMGKRERREGDRRFVCF